MYTHKYNATESREVIYVEIGISAGKVFLCIQPHAQFSGVGTGASGAALAAHFLKKDLNCFKFIPCYNSAILTFKWFAASYSKSLHVLTRFKVSS